MDMARATTFKFGLYNNQKNQTDPDVSKINVTILLHPTSSRFASHSDLKKPQNNHYRINACFVILGKAASFWPLTWLNVR